MIKVPIENLIQKLIEQSGLSETEIKNKISEKTKKFDGLVSEEGAAFMVATDLNIKILDDPSTKILKINELHPGMTGVEIICKIKKIYPSRFFEKEGRKIEYIGIELIDESGTIRTTLWDKRASLVTESRIKEGDSLRIKNCSIRENKYSGKDLQLIANTQIIINQDEVNVDVNKIQITNLDNPTLNSPVKVHGTIVAGNEPRFYRGCIKCNRKITENGCAEHGNESKNIPILSMVLDDGKGNCRITCFGDVANNFYGAELTSESEPNYVGDYISVEGIIRHNASYDRTEMTVNNINRLKAEELILMLKNGA
jgi:DNA/RNA endonuclease YhcR with UshA esterase domain